MQETKYAFMEGIEMAMGGVLAMATVLGKLDFNKEKIKAELDNGFAQATEIADYLVLEGVPFREAHEKSGNLVKHCEKNGIVLHWPEVGKV